MDRLKIISLSLCILLALSACGSRATTSVNNTTLGQELQDLQSAHTLGALTDDEFETQRRRLLRRAN